MSAYSLAYRVHKIMIFTCKRRRCLKLRGGQKLKLTTQASLLSFKASCAILSCHSQSYLRQAVNPLTRPSQAPGTKGWSGPKCSYPFVQASRLMQVQRKKAAGGTAAPLAPFRFVRRWNMANQAACCVTLRDSSRMLKKKTDVYSNKFIDTLCVYSV